MRQAGILAAAGIVALETMIDRLAEDHARARILAERLSRIPGVALDSGLPATNMIFIHLLPETGLMAAEVVARLKERGVLVGAVGKRQFRLVTHYWIDDAGIDRAAEAFTAVL